MSFRINQNIAAFNSYRNLSVTNDMLSKSLEKLSSGFRINRAADDAAGLSVSEGLRAQIGGLQVATRNAQDGISVVQTAEGAMTEVHSILQRMRDLAVQASNTGSQDANALAAAQTEFAQLRTEITRISDTTRFSGQNLLDGTFGVSPAQITLFDADNAVTVAGGDDFAININGTGNVTVELPALAGATGGTTAGALQNAIRTALSAGSAAQQAFADKVTVEAETVGAGTAITIKVGGLANTQTFALTDGTNTPLAALAGTGAVTAASGTGGTFQVGANQGETLAVTIADLDSAALGLDTLDLTTDAAAAITTVSTAITTVSSRRSELGAVQNRLESTINNLNVAVENLSASESRIRDTDMALETVSFTRSQILSQAGTAMLAQANQVPQGVLQLLR